jgi:hypothetical protein
MIGLRIVAEVFCVRAVLALTSRNGTLANRMVSLFTLQATTHAVVEAWGNQVQEVVEAYEN